MGTHPGMPVPMFGLGTHLKMGFQGAIGPNNEWFARVWMLQLAGALQQAHALKRAGALQQAGALQRA